MLFSIYLQAYKIGICWDFFETTKPRLIDSYLLVFGLYLFYLIYLLNVSNKLWLLCYYKILSSTTLTIFQETAADITIYKKI